MTENFDLIARLRRLLGDEGLLIDPAARLVYSRDASHMTLGQPLAVALPETAGQTEAVLAACAEFGVPIVCRGTGTGLSGGAVPPEGALVLSTARMTRLDPVDQTGGRVRVGTGVLNDRVTAHASGHGLHFAPDPSSQSAASIGGNIAENAGGPHCLRHGVTLQHLNRLEWCDARGRRLSTGGHHPAELGFHLTSLLCGSEGTLGVVTAADLALVPDPPEVTTLLAVFPLLDEATAAVVRLLGTGLLPVAVEMVDQSMLQAVEQAFAFGFPTDVQAVMICEFAGQAEEVAEDSSRAVSLLLEAGAREVRRAADLAERLELWKCRKKAFGAVGRLAPRYVTMDVVVPLGQLPQLVSQIQVIKRKHEVAIATAFHAGDGNLHPGVQYDDRDPDQTRRAHAAADEIIRDALSRGGSCTGEHGVGLEKLHAVSWQIDAECAGLQQKIKTLFDPDHLLNPGKLFPPEASEFAPVKPMPDGVSFAWDSLTVSAPATADLAAIQDQALARSLWIPVGVTGNTSGCGLGSSGTVGDLVNHLLPGPGFLAGGSGRDFLLELWAETGDLRLFHSGAPVFKNVAGLDLTHALCGSGGHFVTPRAATFQLRPVPEMAAVFQMTADFGARNFAEKLQGMLSDLGRRSAGTAGANCILDEKAGTVTLVIAGRDRDWDLDRWPKCLQKTWPGLEPAREDSVKFRQAAALLTDEHLPAWVFESSSWSGHVPGPGMDPASCPCGPRLIWQSSPRMWWTPDQQARSGGWLTQVFSSSGERVPLARPEASMPLDLLQGLKGIFDPGNRLGGPAWLTGGADAS